MAGTICQHAKSYISATDLSTNFLCPTKLHLCHEMHSLHFFTHCPDPPHSLPRPPNSPSLLSLQGLRQLSRSRAVEKQRFRWKEIDVLFTIAVNLLPHRTQPMADNYLGRQSRTGGGPIYFTQPFQVPDTLTARGQHGPATPTLMQGRCLHIFNFVSGSTRRGLHPRFLLQMYDERYARA